MTLDPKSGTAGGEGGMSTSTGTAGANAEVEELKSKVADLTAKHDQALAEKSGYEDTKKKLEEAQQMLAQVLSERTSQPPTAGGRGGPTSTIDAEIEQLERVRAQYPNDPLTLRALRSAYQEREAAQWEATRQNAWAVISQVKPDELRERAWQMFSTGAFGTPEAAVYAARGAVSFEEERTKADEEARQKAAARPSTGTGDAGGAAPGAGKPMSGSDYVKFLRDKEGTPEAHQLIAQVDSGRVPVDWTR